MTAKKAKQKSASRDLKPKAVRKSTATKVRGGLQITKKIDKSSPKIYEA